MKEWLDKNDDPSPQPDSTEYVNSAEINSFGNELNNIVTKTGRLLVEGDNFQLSNSVVMSIDSVADIENLEDLNDGDVFYLRGWHPGSNLGGNTFHYDSSIPKSNHDGGQYFSTTVPWTTSTADFLTGAGETDPSGTGCLVVADLSYVRLVQYGGRPDTPAHNDTQSLVNALAAGVLLEEYGGTFTAGGVNFPVTASINCYAVTFDWIGNTSGFTVSSSDISLKGFTIADTTGVISQGITLTGTTNNVVIDNIRMSNMYQYGIQVSSQFNGLTITNTRIEDHGRSGVGISACIDIFPVAASTNLYMHQCTLSVPDGRGAGVIKYHNCSGIVSNCIFSRGNSGGPSASQAVMLGTPAGSASQLKFSHCDITDTTTSLGAMYIRGTGIELDDVKVKGAAADIYISEVTDVTLSRVTSNRLLSLASPNLNGLRVGNGCIINSVDFDADSPVDCTSLEIVGVTIKDQLRLSASGTTANNLVQNCKINGSTSTEHRFYLTDCLTTKNTFTAVETQVGGNYLLWSDGDFVNNDFELAGNRAYALVVTGATGKASRNSFYGFSTAYQTTISGTPTFFHNDVNGVIV